MKTKSVLALSAAVCVIFRLVGCAPAWNEKPAMVPAPVSLEYGKGCFTFEPGTVISVENSAQESLAMYFAGLFTAPAGFTPEVTVGCQDGDVCFLTDSTLAHEAYRLEVTASGISLKASGPAGFFYGLQTIRMSLPPVIESSARVRNVSWKVPAMTVYDYPRFQYRGLMLDVSRYFIPKDEVLRIIDCMALLKLNNLHLHLTDDNGWRIEIKKYPLLTEVGAWRVDRSGIPFPDRRNQRPGEKPDCGGYYTQEDIKEIVRYASSRQVNVIPEIDLPAHSNAALAAYPQYACPVAGRPITVFPGIGEGKWDVIWCAGNDEAFSFLEDVLDEVCELFPSKYIHLGGDEAWKTKWRECPLCQKRIREEHLKDEESLQGYFMNRLNDYLYSKGRTMMGWEELTYSRIPDGAVIFGWQGDGKAALKAASKGHGFVMTPANLMYLIYYQGPQWQEPLSYQGNNTLKDIFEYEPIKKDWDKELSSLLLGVQGSMWTEFCSSPEDVQYQIFPRLAAVAQVAWSEADEKDWDGFVRAVDVFDAHLDAKGIVYSRSMYNIQHRAEPADSMVAVSLECVRPDVEIRYTLDGSDPSSSSEKYRGPLSLDKASELKAATFSPSGKKEGAVLHLPVIWNKATGKAVTGDLNDPYRLTNGVRGSLRQSDFEWSTWKTSERVSFTLDLGADETFSSVTVGCITNYGMMINKPSSVSVEVSHDGAVYMKVASRSYSPAEVFREGNYIEDLEFSFPEIQARYIRVSAEGAGACPSDHLRPGLMSQTCFDEIMVN